MERSLLWNIIAKFLWIRKFIRRLVNQNNCVLNKIICLHFLPEVFFLKKKTLFTSLLAFFLFFSFLLLSATRPRKQNYIFNLSRFKMCLTLVCCTPAPKFKSSNKYNKDCVIHFIYCYCYNTSIQMISIIHNVIPPLMNHK